MFSTEQVTRAQVRLDSDRNKSARARALSLSLSLSLSLTHTHTHSGVLRYFRSRARKERSQPEARRSQGADLPLLCRNKLPGRMTTPLSGLFGPEPPGCTSVSAAARRVLREGAVPSRGRPGNAGTGRRPGSASQWGLINRACPGNSEPLAGGPPARVGPALSLAAWMRCAGKRGPGAGQRTPLGLRGSPPFLAPPPFPSPFRVFPFASSSFSAPSCSSPPRHGF